MIFLWIIWVSLLVVVDGVEIFLSHGPFIIFTPTNQCFCYPRFQPNSREVNHLILKTEATTRKNVPLRLRTKNRNITKFCNRNSLLNTFVFPFSHAHTLWKSIFRSVLKISFFFFSKRLFLLNITEIRLLQRIARKPGIWIKVWKKFQHLIIVRLQCRY